MDEGKKDTRFWWTALIVFQCFALELRIESEQQLSVFD